MFIGIQATGKSTFYANRFADTHLRINLDMLKTRNRERVLLETCIEIGQSVVIDNTNTTVQDRLRYLNIATNSGVPVRGYYFESKVKECLARNDARSGTNRIKQAGLLGTYARLEIPSLDEGFAELNHVHISSLNEFEVTGWQP
jgi:predicted kinase